MNPIVKNPKPIVREPMSVDSAVKKFSAREGYITYHIVNDVVILVLGHHGRYGFLYLRKGKFADLKHESDSAKSTVESALRFIDSGSNTKSHSLGFYKSLKELAAIE